MATAVPDARFDGAESCVEVPLESQAIFKRNIAGITSNGRTQVACVLTSEPYPGIFLWTPGGEDGLHS